MKKQFYVTVLLVISMIFLNTGCGSDGNTADSEKPKTAAIPVEVEMVIVGDIPAVFSGTAHLEAENEATVVAKVPGIVHEILVEEGNYVQKDQILAKLDDEQLKYKLNQAHANLQKLENEYQRGEELYRKNLISTDAFDKIKYDYESLKAAYQLAQLELNYSEIRAPISGVISARHIKVGNMINLNQPTFRITDFDPLNALLYVPERHLNKLKKGQEVNFTVDAIPDEVFTAHVERISPVVDPQSGTFKVTVEIRGQQGLLKPGMFGRVHITYDVHQNTLLIPKEAVSMEDRQASVFIVEDTIAIRRSVVVGYSNTTHLEITEGLREGDTVVTIGQASLKDSSHIQIISSLISSR